MRLFIAEKPSLARAIRAALPGDHTNKKNYIECGSDIVAWCAGHILEPAKPKAYDIAYNLDHLPIVLADSDWKLVVIAEDLFNTLKALLKKATCVVHAGDPDREGQLVVDQVIRHVGYSGPVDRLLISDMTPAAVKKALDAIKPNAAFFSLYEAALARQRADWLYGMNMSRLYTLLGKAGGYDGKLSVGRVQTPLLGLIVRRDHDIETFVPKPFYELKATVETPKGPFVATWKPGAAASECCDDQGRFLDKSKIDALAQKLQGKAGQLTAVEKDKKQKAAPLPYALPDIQVDAAKAFGLSAKQVLDIIQNLYEKHQLVTYPRSDCSYLPEGHFEEAAAVLHAICDHSPDLKPLADGANLSQKSAAFNDKKITAHHAIIPTANTKPATLSEDHLRIYDLICRRYLAQFYPPHRYLQTTIKAAISDELFVAKGRQILDDGWRVIYEAQKQVIDSASDEHEKDEQRVVLPGVQNGDRVIVNQVEVLEKKTTPPKHFTDATLLKAMKGISRFVSDPKIKALLKEADGIGTPATQAQTIEKLFKRAFVERKGKKIVSTPIGRALIEILPDVVIQPDMTAHWEASMKHIANKEMPLEIFLKGIQTQIGEMVKEGKTLKRVTLPGIQIYPCPKCKAPLCRRNHGDTYWACSDRTCKTYLDDKNGKPVERKTYPCRLDGCSGTLRRLKGKHGPFWSCSEYPKCKFSCDDVRGKPAKDTHKKRVFENKTKKNLHPLASS